jgi:lipopolysaccharide export LptBFGC system permease protein LptF
MVDSVDVKKQELYKVRIIDRSNKKIIFAEWGRFLPRDNENNLFPLQLFFTTTQPHIYLPDKLRKRKQKRSNENNIQRRINFVDKKLDRTNKALAKFRALMQKRELNKNEKSARKALIRQKKLLLKEKRKLMDSKKAKGNKNVKKKNDSEDKEDEFSERWDEMSVIYIRDNSVIDPQFSGPQMASITDLMNHIERTKMMLKVLQVKLVNNLVRNHRKYSLLLKKIKKNSGDRELKAKKQNYEKRIKNVKKRIEYYYSGATLDRQILYQFHNKLSIPFACLFFAIIAAPLGVYSKRSGKGIGIGIALLILTFYRILMVVGDIGYSKNIMSPVLGAWLPNVLMVIAAGFFTYMKISSRKIEINMDWLFNIFEKTKKWWESKDYSFMQGVFYIVLFPIKLPFKIIFKTIQWLKLQRHISYSGFKFRKRISSSFDNIYGDIEYERPTQKFPREDKK